MPTCVSPIFLSKNKMEYTLSPTGDKLRIQLNEVLQQELKLMKKKRRIMKELDRLELEWMRGDSQQVISE